VKAIAACLASTLFALAACSSDDKKGPGDTRITYIENEDREMEAAMAEARNSLEEFERRLASPTPTQTMAIIKGKFTEGENSEHMWINEIRVTPQGYRGVLGNQPEFISLKPGQEVLVSRADVSDWVVVDDGRLIGGYTMRVMRARLPEKERAAFEAQNGFRVE
jgi:uncharacterized protein YegJ (DUF2314 family)